ncbi:MAG: hypothetical protein PHE17_18585 [Thiothrix sp.]|uniref:hypothetical protein n=1 Tax=Thiothrix sp. TaxID=1032 RepID=UPI0026302677|nr:hypothetical protein [Thiothrix sp.]MDD5395031.1 hypothetical protein [Thiothrix sp.]
MSSLLVDGHLSLDVVGEGIFGLLFQNIMQGLAAYPRLLPAPFEAMPYYLAASTQSMPTP